MKTYKTNVLFSLIMGLEEAYADVNLDLQADLFTRDYVQSANGYVLTMPAVLLPVFQVYYDYEAKADDGNTLFLRAKPYTASDKATRARRTRRPAGCRRSDARGLRPLCGCWPGTGEPYRVRTALPWRFPTALDRSNPLGCARVLPKTRSPSR